LLGTQFVTELQLGIRGRAWIFGDNINTDLIAPGLRMKLRPSELAAHCLEAVNPRFAAEVQPGDILFAGNGFGIGSSREHAAVSLKLLGLGAVVATSFARIFWRNAVNVGLPALTSDERNLAEDGDEVALDIAAGELRNLTSDTLYHLAPLPEHLLAILGAGGLIPYLKAKQPWRR
jgi:3-isopropylmalate/(R)-2-methylmalate dehydratase small subunit